MSFKIFAISVLFSGLGLVQASGLDGHLLIPKGFDTNDSVEFIISGKLPDLCHRTPSFSIDREGKIFDIQMNAHYVPQRRCRKLSLPYMEKMNLGVLAKGKYTIRLMDFRTVLDEKKVIITEAGSSLRDNFNYGNVTGIRDRGNGSLELLGTNPIDCLKFEKLESSVQGNIVILMPHFREEGECLEEPDSFSMTYQVPENLHGEILIHVRVMNGRSYNYILQRKETL